MFWFKMETARANANLSATFSQLLYEHGSRSSEPTQARRTQGAAVTTSPNRKLLGHRCQCARLHAVRPLGPELEEDNGSSTAAATKKLSPVLTPLTFPV